MDQELASYLDERFRETTTALEGRLMRLEGTIREARTEIGGLREDVQLLAEGMAAGFDEGLEPLRAEVSGQLEEMRKIFHLSHSDLDRRVRLLEVWKERMGNDPIAMVRERFGLKAKEA